MDLSEVDQRPVVVAIVGPNGAGKTTFFHAYLADAGLRFVNADVLAADLGLAPFEAARLADALRRELVKSRESFVFETVFSDPVGDKVSFLEEAAQNGYIVVLCYIGLAGPEHSVQRVAMRVSQGGHDVPDEKLLSRFARTIDNLRRAISRLPHVLIYDNSDLGSPFRHIASFDHGQRNYLQQPVPVWLQQAFPV